MIRDALFYFCILIILYQTIRYLFRKIKFKKQNHITNQTIVLITGGCLGIGRELIGCLINNFNCAVVNLDIREDQFPILCSTYKTKNLINIYCDLSNNDNDYNKLLEKAKIKFESIDILINNAGIAFNKSFKSLSSFQLTKTIQINLLSPMLLCKAVIDSKINTSSTVHIVTISSAMSHLVSPNSSDYIATKWGLFGFHESLRSEYLDKPNIHFTIFCPYAVNTGMFPGFSSPLPFILNILDAKEYSNEIIYSIVLKDKIVYSPFYIEYICIFYSILPCWIRDLLQNFICKNI